MNMLGVFYFSKAQLVISQMREFVIELNPKRITKLNPKSGNVSINRT